MRKSIPLLGEIRDSKLARRASGLLVPEFPSYAEAEAKEAHRKSSDRPLVFATFASALIAVLALVVSYLGWLNQSELNGNQTRLNESQLTANNSAVLQAERQTASGLTWWAEPSGTVDGSAPLVTIQNSSSIPLHVYKISGYFDDVFFLGLPWADSAALLTIPPCMKFSFLFPGKDLRFDEVLFTDGQTEWSRSRFGNLEKAPVAVLENEMFEIHTGERAAIFLAPNFDGESEPAGEGMIQTFGKRDLNVRWGAAPGCS